MKKATKHCTGQPWWRQAVLQAMVCLGLAAMLPAAATADTIVRVSTTFGDFSIELFDEQTPATVENFLNYVERGDYDGSFIHRSEPDFVVQGGGYHFVPFEGPVAIPRDPPVANEPGISNTRGTVTMAKLEGDPDSATSQWFVNVSDNSESLDEQNGGFTVFGQVLGDGMEVVDRINEQTTCNLGGFAAAIPLLDFDCQTDGFPVDEDLVKLAVHPVDRFSTAMHVYENSTGELFTKVEAGDLGVLNLRMSVVASEPEMVFQVDQDSMLEMGIEPEGVGSYLPDEEELRIPRVEVNDDGEVYEITNVVMSLSDPDTLRFTLDSYDQ